LFAPAKKQTTGKECVCAPAQTQRGIFGARAASEAAPQGRSPQAEGTQGAAAEGEAKPEPAGEGRELRRAAGNTAATPCPRVFCAGATMHFLSPL